MDSLDQQKTQHHDLPRFDDGMINIQELIRVMAESIVNEIMDAQAEMHAMMATRGTGIASVAS